MYNAENFIRENDFIIRKCVRAFAIKQLSYGTLHADEDEFYQVCVHALLEMDAPPDYLTLTLKHAMCRHNLSLLPVSISLSTTDYTQKLRRIKALPMDAITIFAERGVETAFQNAEFWADMERVKAQLPKRDGKIIDLLLDGWNYTEIGRALSVSKAAMHRAKKRIAKCYAAYMEDQDEPDCGSCR